MNKDSYIYIISENCKLENGQKWIIDVFASEFIKYSGLSFTDKMEKALGLEAKEYLKKNIKDVKDIVIKTELPDSSEKYGRILGWVYVDGGTKSVNEKMIEDGYAWGYLGDTKVKDFEALAKQRKMSGK